VLRFFFFFFLFVFFLVVFFFFILGLAPGRRGSAPAASAAGFLLTLFYGSRAHSATFGWRLMGSFITVQLKRGQ
ncbi:hypothetical protein ACEZEZ_24750, partial [Kluyvera ascorbata]|uniref:hypothetical protein n=1 Tax=Kluyvera ascorbata TaxID=51288 RepID=UPI0035CD0EB2